MEKNQVLDTGEKQKKVLKDRGNGEWGKILYKSM